MKKNKMVTLISAFALTMTLGATTVSANVNKSFTSKGVVSTHVYKRTAYKAPKKAVRVYTTKSMKNYSNKKLAKVVYSTKSINVKKSTGKVAVYRYLKNSKGQFIGLTWRHNLTPGAKTNATISYNPSKTASKKTVKKVTKKTVKKAATKKTVAKKSTSKKMNVKANPKYHASTVATNVPTKALTMGSHSVKPLTTKVSDVNVDARTNFKGVNGLATLRDRINKLITIANEHPDAWKNVKEFKGNDQEDYNRGVFYAISDLSDSFGQFISAPARYGQSPVDHFNKQAQKMISEANY